MKTLQEIEARLAEIKADMEIRGSAMTADELTKIEAEVKELTEARTNLLAKDEETRKKQEHRTKILDFLADGKIPTDIVRKFDGENRKIDSEDKYDSMEYRKAFLAHVVRGADIPVEYRADETSKTSDVGVAIPTTVLNKIIEKLEAVGMILPLITRTAYKGGVSIPTSSVKPVASWVAEGTKSDKQKKTIGSITFSYHKLRCAVAVSLEVDNMALSAFEATLINNIVEAMTKAIEQAIITGTGSGQPTGILSTTVPTGQTISIVTPAYKDLIAAEAALPQAYEANAVWCMSKKTFMEYAGLTDSNGQPIGRVNYGIDNKIERFLLGRAVVCCDYVTSYNSSVAAGTKFAFLFNFKDYVLNTNYNMGVKKYEDNETDDQITKAVMLVDGKVVDANSLVVMSKKAS